VSLIKHIGYDEGLPVVTDPKIIDPRSFIDEVINVRLPNPFLPDTPQRIACDTSQKVGIRFGQTIKAYDDKAGGLVYIPIALAGWLRYLAGCDDNGTIFEPSPDPMLEELAPIIKSVMVKPCTVISDKEKIHSELSSILSRSDIFTVDLYAVGLGNKIEEYFIEMGNGCGSIKQTLEKYCR
jgi:fructuronate reductase